MRFIFEFVSCCVPMNMCRVDDPETAAAEKAEETRSLALTTTRKHRRRKRGPSLPSGSDWKPSLGAISEEKVVLVVMGREKSDDQTAETQRSVKRKNGSREDRVHDRNNSNDFRRSPAAIPVLIPAFSPTPFLF